MRAITGLTATYMILVAALMFYMSDAGSRVGGVILGEVIFALPMLAAWSAAEMMKRQESRRIMLTFSMIYPLLSALAFVSIVTGEHDAQWQLSFLLIPMTGFSAVLIFGLIAACCGRPQNASR